MTDGLAHGRGAVGGARAVVLALVGWYLPGFRSGGPLQAVSQLVAHLGDEFEFRILTRDRDLGEDAPYDGVRYGEWTEVGAAQVRYLSPAEVRNGAPGRLLRTVSHDLVYHASMLSPQFTVLPLALRRAGRVPPRPVIVSPRGELAPGALAQKPARKRAFLSLARGAGLYRDVLWHATWDEEAAEVRRWFGAGARVHRAPDLARPVARPQGERPAKVAGRLRAVFLSRIDRKKNLLGAIRLLSRARTPVELHVYGPVGDAAYWDACLRAAEGLGNGTRVHYHGPVPHDRVATVFRDHDLFLFPTLGENYGYVIQEALQAGCPVLVSDRTPWRGLEEARAGWDLPLDDEGAFLEVLSRCAAMGAEEHAEWSRGAVRMAHETRAGPELVAQSRALFRAAVQAGRRPAG